MAHAYRGRETLRLGTRGSALALAQSEWFAARLREHGHSVEIIRIVTDGDVRPVDTAPGEGMFVAAIAAALLRGDVDVAVHSAKDVPLAADPSLAIAAYPARADARDALVTTSGTRTLATLRPGAKVGTDSPRRAGFLRASRRDLEVVAFHGNVDTRLRRLDAGEVDAIVVACAGLDRLGRGGRIDQRLAPDVVTPAPAQGALAVQARSDRADLLAVLGGFDDPDVRAAVEAERRVLSATGGTCRAPVGALADIDGDVLTMVVGGVNSDGSDRRVETVRGRLADALELADAAGRRLAAAVVLR